MNPFRCIHPQCSECEKEQEKEEQGDFVTWVRVHGVKLFIFIRSDGTYYVEEVTETR